MHVSLIFLQPKFLYYLRHILTIKLACYLYLDQLNSTTHGTMLKSPYELVFGQPPRHNLFPGVEGSLISEEEVDDIIEDEDGTIPYAIQCARY